MSISPALNIAGSFVPAWLLCLVLGGVVAGLFRLLFGVTGLKEGLPFPSLTYLGIMLSAAIALWLFVFGG